MADVATSNAASWRVLDALLDVCFAPGPLSQEVVMATEMYLECVGCRREVTPNGKGRCPHCGQAVVRVSVAYKGPDTVDEVAEVSP